MILLILFISAIILRFFFIYLWDDVKEFNSDLEYAQYWANNYWTNWMNERACNEFETFDIPDYKRSNE